MLSTFDVDIFSFIYHLASFFTFTKQKKKNIHYYYFIYFCRTEIKNVVKIESLFVLIKAKKQKTKEIIFKLSKCTMKLINRLPKYFLNNK